MKVHINIDYDGGFILYIGLYTVFVFDYHSPYHSPSTFNIHYVQMENDQKARREKTSGKQDIHFRDW